MPLFILNISKYWDNLPITIVDKKGDSMSFGITLRGKRIACGLCLAIAVAIPIFSDVVYLKDGSILIATYQSTSGETMTYSSGESQTHIKASDILRSESTLASLKGKTVALELTDKSTVKGVFADYDEEIGYFVDLTFGTLTVPREKVVRMVDPAQSRRYQGSDVALGVRGFYLAPVNSDFFSSMYGGGASAEFCLSFFRGLFGGTDVDCIKLNTDGLDDLSYFLIQVTPKLTFRYLEFRSGQGFLSHIVPFVSVGGGMTAIYVHDLRDGVYPDSYGELSPHIKAELGTDIYLKDKLYLRLGGVWTTIFQEGDSFSGAGASLACYYEL